MNRIFCNLLIVTIFVSITINQEKVLSNTNLFPTIKEHRAFLKATGKESITTIIQTTEWAEAEATITASLTTNRDNWANTFRTTMELTGGECPECEIYMNQGHPGNPEEYENDALYISETNMNDCVIYERGEEIDHRFNSEINATYPLMEGYELGVTGGDSYYIESGIMIQEDYQDVYWVEWRCALILPDGSSYISPNDDEVNDDSYDQQGWPVEQGYWDLRPDLCPTNVQIKRISDDSIIDVDNPAYVDEQLYASYCVTENEGFWVGDVYSYYYLDDLNFDSGTIYNLSANNIDCENSNNFTVSYTGQHSLSIDSDPNYEINETNEDNNGMTSYFSVIEAPMAPTVTIDDPIHIDWNTVLINWTGNDINNDILEFRWKIVNGGFWTLWGDDTSRILHNLSPGNHYFYVEARDPTNLIGTDNIIYTIDSPITITAIPDQSIIYELSLEFDIFASGGSGLYNYSAVYGNIDSNGHYSWIPYNPVSYNELITVTCSEFESNSNSEDLLITVISPSSIEPLELLFPSIETTLEVTITNTTVNGSSFNYALSLSNETYYDILSELSGNLSSGEQAIVEVMSYVNNNPYELSALLQISINSGIFNSVVELTTQTDCNLASGDVNGDEIVDILDIITTVSFVLENLELDPCQYEVAEINGDGQIDILDIIMIIDIVIEN
ncbi:hypothetical protein HN800_04850 [bacterium]|jgi:hypothetical protein|nr:hypothetical protein [bacterium]MBT5401768.1 hypothetical protein [bacterium]MBT5942056.1 hypothetical protein [bacterium]MBT6067636.1 hypothetical protein [bacterium]MBT6336076.1 hypothetical protein [bacterium]